MIPSESEWGIVVDKLQNNECITFSEFKMTVNGDFEHLDRQVVNHMLESEPKRKRQWLASGGDKIDYRGYLVQIPCTVTTHQNFQKSRTAWRPNR